MSPPVGDRGGRTDTVATMDLPGSIHGDVQVHSTTVTVVVMVRTSSVEPRNVTSGPRGLSHRDPSRRVPVATYSS